MLAVAQGCSPGAQENQPPKAVEVGNPQDSKPTKQTPDVEQKTLVVQIQPGNLQEIEHIEFFVDSIQLLAASSSGEKFELIPEEGTESAKLSLRPGAIATMRFRLPAELDLAKATAALELKFSGPSPGNVSVDGESIAIEERSESLLLPIDSTTTPGNENDVLVTKKIVKKDDLFEPPTAAGTGVLQNPSSTLSTPVYRLKSSP
jgi:hypothetical protein